MSLSKPLTTGERQRIESELSLSSSSICTHNSLGALASVRITFADGDLHGSCRWAAQTLGIFIKMYDVVLYGSELLSCTEGQELSDEVAELWVVVVACLRAYMLKSDCMRVTLRSLKVSHSALRHPCTVQESLEDNPYVGAQPQAS